MARGAKARLSCESGTSSRLFESEGPGSSTRLEEFGSLTKPKPPPFDSSCCPQSILQRPEGSVMVFGAVEVQTGPEPSYILIVIRIIHRR